MDQKTKQLRDLTWELHELTVDLDLKLNPALKENLERGVIVRYNGANNGGSKPPPTDAVGMIIAVEDHTNDVDYDSDQVDFKVLFPPYTCSPNPYLAKRNHLEIVDTFKK